MAAALTMRKELHVAWTRPWCLRVLLPLLLTVSPCEATNQLSHVHLGGTTGSMQEKYAFLGKFGFGTGTGNYSIRFRLAGKVGDPGRPSKNVSLRLESFLDEDWDAALQVQDVCARKNYTKKTKLVRLTPDGRWTEIIPGTVTQNIRSHFWYYTLTDCQLVPRQLLAGRVKIDYELLFLQQGGSHFGVDQRWTLPANIISLICFMAFSVFFAMRCRQEAQSSGRVHPVIWQLSAIVVMQLSSQFLHAVHIMRYSSNGAGIRPMEIIAETLFILSQLFLSTLLICIGLGYTLMPVDMAPEKVVPVVGFAAVVHITLVALSKNEDGSADKSHAHDGWPGSLLLAIRLLMFAVFLWAVQCTGKGAGLRLRNFLFNFRLGGSFYFLGYPLLVLVVKPFAPYLRPPALAFFHLVIQIVINLWLHSLFLSRGEYFKVSEMGNSPLPGGTPRSSPRGDKSD